MKFSYLITLFSIIVLASSCRTSQQNAMKVHYRNVNKYSAMENRLLSDNNLMEQNTSPKKKTSLQDAYNLSSEEAYMNQVKSKSNQYKVLYDDSEIANGDVYREAAAHRKKLMEQANKDCNCGTDKDKKNVVLTAAQTKTDTNTTTNTTVVDAPRSPEVFGHLLDEDKNTIRKVGLTFFNESDKPLLKKFSVIIASLSRPAGMERLKKAFANSNDRIFFVQNEVGIYYAIIGSYETEAEADQKLKRVQQEYNNIYTTKQLLDKYGIPFSDLWILRK